MAAKKKDFYSTPMRGVPPIPSLKGSPGVYDHHTTPGLTHPHSMGKDTIPVKMFEDMPVNAKALVPPPAKGTASRIGKKR